MPVRDNGKPSSTSTSSGDKDDTISKGNTEGIHAALKPFLFHGMVFNDVKSWDTQAKAECFLCGKESKFYVGLKDVDKKHFAGGWECKSCASSGNVYTFIQHLHETSKDTTSEADLRDLADDRGLLHTSTLERWGVVKSVLTGEWLVPGYNVDGSINQLYRYAVLYSTGNGAKSKKALLGTPGLNAGLFGTSKSFCDTKVKIVDICEGPWDGMAWEEVLFHCKKRADGTLTETASPGGSLCLLGERIVVAAPGAATFNPAWNTLTGGRTVNLLYDNDHERKNPKTQQIIEGAGLLGIKKVVGIFSVASVQPKEVRYLDWSGIDKQWNSELPDGTDIRDLFSQEPTIGERGNQAVTVFNALKPVPAEWIQQGKGGHAGSVALEPIPCEDWLVLDTACRKAMKWTKGLRDGLINMLAVSCGVPVVGEQLWMKIVGPPSCGKTSLCEALSVARKFVLPKDTFSGLASGYQTDKEGSENLSLVLKIHNKTLAIKDADTILQHPNKSQILSQFRGLYDRAFRTQYNNKMSMDHDNVNTGVILCGTSSLRALDDSELGQRFLDYEIMSAVDCDLEEEINVRSLNHYRELMSKSPMVNGEGADSPERAMMKRLTGGYVEYLQANAERLIMQTEMSDAALDLCNRCGKFVAYFRSRPSGKQSEEVHRELSTRLVLQCAKLAYCLAVVLNRKSVDDEIQGRVRHVALCTARGRTLEIAKLLYVAQERGVETKNVSVYLGETDEKVRHLLRFLRRIGVVDHFEYEFDSGIKKWRWRLSAAIKELYADLLDPDGSLIAQYQGYE